MEKIKASDREIDLMEMEITDEEIEEIASFIVENKPHVQDIFLGCNYLSDEGAFILERTLSHLKHLSFLEIQENQLDIEGIVALNKLAFIRPSLRIAINGNKVTDAKVIEEIRKDTFKPRSTIKP